MNDLRFAFRTPGNSPAYVVRRRTDEIGLRRALRATRVGSMFALRAE